ncbi:hypothetical protein ACFQJ7_11205 [Halovenus rubra]|jgi:hypothetical protein|uniref:CopG family transcriptional regulator n=2 Tax=Halovenus rubra TaxID=869890 RepID=A0ABD5X9I4_9EURY|nr:hypothetical protein [Halovenus rubra]
MRPNIDITHTLHGRIKDYAEDKEMELSEAYSELLERGLESVAHPDES